MDTEVIITNWGGLSGRFLNLLTTGDMFDVQLQVGAQLFDAHKLILSASSDVFKTMLTNQKWSEAHKQTIELVEEPLCESVFGRFIHYIYTGQLYLSHRTACPMLTLADKYNVKELIPLCRNYMLENLEAPVHLSSVLQWWRVANLRSDMEMERKILQFIELNFNKIIQSPDFLHTSIESVEKLISSSKLVVYNELMIFCGVLQWMQIYMDCHNPTLSEAKDIFSRLLGHVRWRFMSADEINWLKANRNVQNILSKLSFQLNSNPASTLCIISKDKVKDYSDQFVCNLSSSFNASNLHFKSFNDESASGKYFKGKYLPNKISGVNRRCDSISQQFARVYTSDYWATELTVQNFSSFPQYKVQTFIFSTPKTGFSEDDGQNLEWEVELHPKGVHFPPAIMIGVDSEGSKLIDELFVDTVRLSVMSRSPHEMPLKVEVNILVRANSTSDVGTTYFERCHSRTCFFESESQRHNFDDLVPLDNLSSYLQPCSPMPGMFLTPTVAFSLCIIIRPLPP